MNILRRVLEICFPKPSEPTHSDSSHEHHKKEPIPHEIREAVWMKYHGNADQGICYCCGKIIQRYNAGWHCSHVTASAKNGKITVENLRTCCPHCNLSMGSQCLYTYIRDKGLKGPGAKNVKSYMKRHPSQEFDKRTNNWGHN